MRYYYIKSDANVKKKISLTFQSYFDIIYPSTEKRRRKMNELTVLILMLPVGIIAAIAVKIWMLNLTPARRHARMLNRLKKIDRKSWDTYIKENT